VGGGVVTEPDEPRRERARETTSADAEIAGRRLAPVAGLLLLWGLGVGYVISGDYYGWNFGLTETGYWGYLIALAFVGLLYAVMAVVIAEMAAAIPHSGGPYAFARMALGKIGGYLCGVGVMMQYIIAQAAVATAIGAYINEFVPAIPVLVSAVAVYVVFTAIHLFGAGTSLKVELIFTVIATAGLLVFCAVGLPNVTLENLNEVGGGEVLPNGIAGFWATLPLAAWFFFALEGLPMASEEASDPGRDMPKALVTTWVTLAIVAVLTLTVTAGVGGARTIGGADAPLPAAIRAGLGADHWLIGIVSFFALASLLASFHAIVLAYSRQTFALSRTGYLPRLLADVNRWHAPTWSLVVPALIGIGLVILGSVLPGSAIPVLLTTAVFAATVTYVLMMVSAIVLRRRRPDLRRPFEVPGGQVTAGVGVVLAAILLPAGVAGYPVAILIAAVVFIAFTAYYLLHSRHHLVSESIEEELELIEEAEAELKG
jgi:ethanolamine permease